MLSTLVVATKNTRPILSELLQRLDMNLVFSDQPIEAITIAEDKEKPFDLMLLDVAHPETLEAMDYARDLDCYAMIYLFSATEDSRAKFNLEKQALELRILLRGLIPEFQ